MESHANITNDNVNVSSIISIKQLKDSIRIILQPRSQISIKEAILIWDNKKDSTIKQYFRGYSFMLLDDKGARKEYSLNNDKEILNVFMRLASINLRQIVYDMWNNGTDNFLKKAIKNNLKVLDETKRTSLLKCILIYCQKIAPEYLQYEDQGIIEGTLKIFKDKKPKSTAGKKTLADYNKNIKLLEDYLQHECPSNSVSTQCTNNSSATLITSIDSIDDLEKTINNHFIKEITIDTNKIWQDSEVVRDYLKGKPVILSDAAGEKNLIL